MRKLNDSHEVWWVGDFASLSELAEHLVIGVKALEADYAITAISIDAGDALDKWSATIVALPE
jgi:hypothetical protein